MKKITRILVLVLVLSLLTTACSEKDEPVDDGRYNVVATTTIVGDLLRQIGGDSVNVISLMGPGIDPHLYKASAGDVRKMNRADMVVFNGLHLEGKMVDIFENFRSDRKVIFSVSENIDESKLFDFITNPGHYDPHIWFDVALWKEAAIRVAEGLGELSEENEDYFQARLENYLEELDELDGYVRARVEEIPEDKRILVTAHDAFQYFGDAYGFIVTGLQGISTESEAGTSDVRNLAEFIVERSIKAIFVESSVPRKNIEALQEAVRARGFNVEIGGELYSDSTGDIGSKAESYIGTFKANIDTIVEGLK